MSLGRRVIISVLKRPFRALAMAMLIFSLAVINMAGTFLSDINDAYYNEYIRMEGFSVFVSTTDGTDIPEALLDKIHSLDLMIGSNYTPVELPCTPIDFENVPYEATGPISVAENTGRVMLIGNYDASLYESFRNSEMVLIEGEYPDQAKEGILIDSCVAEKNGLGIGSVVHLISVGGDTENAVSVIGIYETMTPPTTAAASGGTVVESSSYVFSDMNTYCALSGSLESLYCRYFFSSSAESLGALQEDIRAIVPNNYQVVNALANTIAGNADAIQTLQGMSRMLIRFSYVISLIILFLMTMLWMKDHYREAGIYITLGASRAKVVLYFWLEILFVSVVAILISQWAGGLIIQRNSHAIIDFTLSFANSSFTLESVDAAVFSTFSALSLVKSNLVFLAVISAATLISGWIMIGRGIRKLIYSD